VRRCPVDGERALAVRVVVTNPAQITLDTVTPIESRAATDTTVFSTPPIGQRVHRSAGRQVFGPSP
jgi:hypothetical protein